MHLPLLFLYKQCYYAFFLFFLTKSPTKLSKKSVSNITRKC